MAGQLDDPRVQRAVDWITTYQRFDDAEGDAPTGWPYDKREMCWGRHTGPSPPRGNVTRPVP